MRILHLNPFYFPYAGGIERRIRELGRRLGRKHEFIVLTSRLPGTDREEESGGIRVVRLRSRYRFGRFYNPPMVSTPGLEAAIRDLRPDVIDFYYRWSPGYSRAFSNARASRVFTYHNTFGEGTGLLGALSQINDRRAKRFVARSDRIVCISQFIRDDLERRGFPRGKLRVVHNGIGPSQPSGNGTVAAQRTMLVAVGRLVDTKGFDVAIRALTHLPEAIRLTVCGQGPRRAALQRLANRLDVAKRVRLAGWVPETEKLELLRSSLAVVHPARFESFGISILEALALGAPVVATRVGGIPEVVGDGGRLVAAEDFKALAAVVRELHEDASLWSTLSAGARRQAERFDWEEAAEKTERVYAEALGEGG